jgi:hypothetical protein
MNAVVRSSDNLSGKLRDKIQHEGAAWVAPLEFLSEVFVEGKPLSKPAFEKDARPLDGGVRAPTLGSHRRRGAADRVDAVHRSRRAWRRPAEQPLERVHVGRHVERRPVGRVAAARIGAHVESAAATS